MLSTPKHPTTSIDRAKRRIKGASFAAFTAATVTAIGILIIAWDDKSVEPLVFLLDPILIAGLGYGVRKGSRACAIGLLMYWVLSKAAQLGNMEITFWWLCLVLAFAYLFLAGVTGTIALHRLQRNAPKPNAGPAGSR